MIITKKVEKELNRQIAMEANAFFTYLSMASWCDSRGMEGGARFFYQHASEEHDHMMKIVHFVNEIGGEAIIPAVAKPAGKFTDIQQICEVAFKHEKKVSQSIHKIVNVTINENDHVTHDFLQFFVDEQREEEVLFMKVLDKIKLIGKGGQSLYYIDKELDRIANTEEKNVEQ